MPAWKKVIVSGSAASLSSIHVSGDITASIVSASKITGSLFGTSSWASNFFTSSVTSASFATTASYLNPLNQGNVIITGSVYISGSTNLIGNTRLTGSLLLTQSAISSVDYIDFRTSANPTHLEGRIHWTDDTKTLQVDTDVNNLMIELGHQQVVRVRNENPFTIPKGKIIYISGSSGNRPLIFTSSIETDALSAGTVGMVAADIGSSNNGYVITRGTIRDINTNAYLPGALLYLSTSGDWSTNAPEAPLHEVRIGKVVTQATAGIIYIDIMNGYEIGELHDVVDTNGQIGDLLVRSGSSPSNVFRNTKQLTGSYGVTGSWNVQGSILASTGFTGSLLGTASFTTTASYVRNLYITASSTAPVSPTDNELWYDVDNGKTYIRYNDGTSTQWVLQSDPTIDVNTSLQTLQEVTDLGTTTTHAISITNTTNATDTSSGAFIVDGGAGFGLDVWARKFYGDGSALTGVVAASIVEVDTLQTVTTRGTDTSASIFITNITNATSGGAGALRVSGGLYVGENIWAKNITSSLEGTASWARNANSASFVTGSIFTGGNLVLSSSFARSASIAVTSSFSNTSSFVEYTNVANKPSLFSGSSQVQLNQITGTTFADTLYTFPGDIVVQGNVTAEQLIISTSVYFVTTSFSSGSTIFGNDVNDSHRFTGSLFVSGATFITGSTQITGSLRVLGGINATSLTGSLTASSLIGDIILGTQTSGSFVSTLTQGTGVTITGLSAEGSNPTISIGQAVGTTANVQFNQITSSIISASQFSGSLFGTSSWASNVVGGYVTSVAGTTNEILVNGNTTAANGAVTLSLPSTVDLGAGSSLIATSLTGSITASSLQGAITNTQLQNSSVTIGSTAVSLGGTATTITGVVSLTTTNLTSSIISASNFISGGQIVATTGFTGSISASGLKGAILNSQLQNSSVTVGNTNIALGATSTTIAGLVSLSSTSITASLISASAGLTGSLTASFLIGDIILGTQTSGQYASTITGGSGLTATSANANDGTAYTIDVVAGAGISLTAPTNDAINVDTGSAHFTGGVTNRLNSSNVLSGSVSSPSQGTISVGGFTNIDLGLQTGDDVTFNKVTATNGLTGSLTASSLIGDIRLGVQTSGDYVSTLTQGTGVTITGGTGEGSNPTIAIGQAVATTSNVQFASITASIVSASNHISGGQIVATTGFTGSLSASFLKGAILNSQLQNSSVTIGSTAVSLGATATTVTGLVSVNSTSVTASVVSASQFTGSLFGSASYSLTSSFAITASYALNAGGGVGFPFTGSAQITGSLGITGSISATGALTSSLAQGYVWVGGAGNITTLVPTSSFGGGSSGGNAKLNQSTPATTWSFGHFLGEIYPNITVFDSNGGVIIPGRIETVDANNLNVYFDVATAGVVVASVGGTATTINAQSASYYTGNEIIIGTTTFTPAVTSSLGATTTTVSRVWTGSFSGAFWDYVVNNGTNYRAGMVMGVWNKIGSAQFTDTSTPDIGNTSQLTFGVVINGEYAELRSTTTTSGWNVKTFVRKI